MPVINGIIAIYNAINSAVKYIVKILNIVNSILDTTIAIASGSIGPAAKKLEEALARSMPVVIGFLADQLGLDNVVEAINGVIDTIRGKVDKAIDWLIDKALQLGRALLESLGLIEKRKDTPNVADTPDSSAIKSKALESFSKKIHTKKIADVQDLHVILSDTFDIHKGFGLKSLAVNVNSIDTMDIAVEASASPSNKMTIKWSEIFDVSDLTPEERSKLNDVIISFTTGRSIGEKTGILSDYKGSTITFVSLNGRLIHTVANIKGQAAC